MTIDGAMVVIFLIAIAIAVGGFLLAFVGLKGLFDGLDDYDL